ncbi:unnamed protein product [Clonostachys rosea f. rosea IK726]|uniref:Uncharacterized protein n=1 Tax=Clonostachys rosea f. rosea IK726 TaxID=1349383 RepID=A0ACA9TKP4_BIOOC|nr:unnamed protein product [Clonostachys rosea f. rosea IK726]
MQRHPDGESKAIIKDSSLTRNRMMQFHLASKPASQPDPTTPPPLGRLRACACAYGIIPRWGFDQPPADPTWLWSPSMTMQTCGFKAEQSPAIGFNKA